MEMKHLLEITDSIIAILLLFLEDEKMHPQRYHSGTTHDGSLLELLKMHVQEYQVERGSNVAIQN